MIDYEKLLFDKTISKYQLLLNYYSLINISETELVILLLIENMLDSNVLVTTKALEERMNISSIKIDNSIKRLIEKKYICFDTYSNSNNIDTSAIYQKIIDKLIENDISNGEKQQQKQEGNIISVFEKEFKRKLSPFEIETVREWYQTFDEELIIYALREAVLMGIVNLKYIEKIIVEQAKIING